MFLCRLGDFLKELDLTEGRMWFNPALIKTEALDRIIRCNRNHTELDMIELLHDIMETQGVDKVSFIPQDLIPLLTMNGVKSGMTLLLV